MFVLGNSHSLQHVFAEKICKKLIYEILQKPDKWRTEIPAQCSKFSNICILLCGNKDDVADYDGFIGSMYIEQCHLV